MSFVFSSQQYDDTYQPKRQRNWQYGVKNMRINPRRRCGVTVPIADCNGHLLPHVKRNPCSSPWGDYRGWIWEEPLTKCDCTDRIKHPHDYDRPPCTILVTRERPCHHKEAQITANVIAPQLFQQGQRDEVGIMNPQKSLEDNNNAQEAEDYAANACGGQAFGYCCE